MISELPTARPARWLQPGPHRRADAGQRGLCRRACEGEGLPLPGAAACVTRCSTRQGGLYFGIAILLDYPAPYSLPLYRFADFNAGRYSSRNAAFQRRCPGSAASPGLDGDLLRYTDGAPAEPSATLTALQGLGPVGPSRAEIQRDLRSRRPPGLRPRLTHPFLRSPTTVPAPGSPGRPCHASTSRARRSSAS
jgi:hypothetical protein